MRETEYFKVTIVCLKCNFFHVRVCTSEQEPYVSFGIPFVTSKLTISETITGVKFRLLITDKRDNSQRSLLYFKINMSRRLLLRIIFKKHRARQKKENPEIHYLKPKKVIGTCVHVYVPKSIHAKDFLSQIELADENV